MTKDMSLKEAEVVSACIGINFVKQYLSSKVANNTNKNNKKRKKMHTITGTIGMPN